MRRFLTAVVVGILFAATFSEPALAAPAPTPYGFLQPLHAVSKCLDVPRYAVNNNVVIDQWTCVAQTNVAWRVEAPNPRYPDQVWIRNQHSQKCLTVLGGSKARGAFIVQYTCTTVNWNGLWWVTKHRDSRGTYYDFTNMNSVLNLNIEGAFTHNGARLIQWPYGAVSWNNFFYFPTDLGPFAS